MATIDRNATDAGLRDWLRSHVGLRIAELASRSEEGATTMVRVQLLGAPQLQARDGALRALERREAALLALLAIEGPLPRARAAALLWADADSEHARSSLRQRLFKLRRSAGVDVVVPGDVLRIAEDVEHDLVPIATRLADDPAAGAAELLGELDYSDCPGLADWVAVAREQWRSRRVQALAEIAARLEAEQKVAAALPYAERLVADDPTLEHGHRRLMRLHYLRGDRAAALAAYDRCHELLRLALGTAPGAETQALRKLVEGSGALPVSGARPLPLAILRPPRLIGREAEWTALDDTLRVGRALLVHGEPGIGKTRLLGDWASALAAPRAVRAGARPGDDRIPYALVAVLMRALAPLHPPPANERMRAELARLLPELGAGAPGPLETTTLRMALSAWLRSAVEGGLVALVLDDLHFADAASVEALLHCVAQCAPLAWVLAARSGDLPPALSAWLAAGDLDGLRELHLGPLAEAAIRQLLESLDIDAIGVDKLAAALARHTGGNPLFLLETLRAQLARGPARAEDLPAPASVGQLISRRLERLSPAALKLARVAAIAGQDFGPELAAHVLAQDPLDLVDAWAELEHAQVIRDNAFSHDLVHRAVESSIPSSISQMLHRKVASFLEAAEAEPAGVAAHWEAAGQWLAAARRHEAAAGLARALSLRKLERDRLASAVANYDRAGAYDEQLAALFMLVQASRLVDPHATARAHAVQLLDRARNDDQRALALEAMALIHNDAFEFMASLDTLQRLHSLPSGALSPPRAKSVARIEATALSQLDRHAQALARLEPYLAPAMACPGEPDNPSLLCDYAISLIACERNRDAQHVLTAARNGAEASHDVVALYGAYTGLAWSSYGLGRLAESTRHYEQARRTHDALGSDRPPQNKHQVGLARQYRELGRFAEARALIEATVEEQRTARNAALMAICACEQSALYLTLGQTARAVQVLVEPSGVVASSIYGGYLFARAQIARVEQRPFKALLEEAIERVAPEGRAYYTLRLQLELCRALEPDDAADLALRIVGKAEQLQLACIELPGLAIAADALVRGEQFALATGLAARFVDRLEDLAPVVLFAPLYWWIAYRAFGGDGLSETAREMLRRGRSWIQETALPNVPSEFRDSFLHRNPINRDLLAAAHRLLD